MRKEDIGKRIQEARRSRDLTQEKLAEKADIGVTYLGEIERGKKLPSMKVFIKLVETLGISADSILRDDLTSGKTLVINEISQKLEPLTPRQVKTISDMIDAYISNLE